MRHREEMQTRIRFILFVSCWLMPFLHAQDGHSEAGIKFLGEVQSVDAAHHTIAVKHSQIPGYEARGISEYSVEGEAAFKWLHAGDDIRATVYPNDRTLHHIELVYRRHSN